MTSPPLTHLVPNPRANRPKVPKVLNGQTTQALVLPLTKVSIQVRESLSPRDRTLTIHEMIHGNNGRVLEKILTQMVLTHGQVRVLQLILHPRINGAHPVGIPKIQAQLNLTINPDGLVLTLKKKLPLRPATPRRMLAVLVMEIPMAKEIPPRLEFGSWFFLLFGALRVQCIEDQDNAMIAKLLLQSLALWVRMLLVHIRRASSVSITTHGWICSPKVRNGSDQSPRFRLPLNTAFSNSSWITALSHIRESLLA